MIRVFHRANHVFIKKVSLHFTVLLTTVLLCKDYSLDLLQVVLVVPVVLVVWAIPERKGSFFERHSLIYNGGGVSPVQTDLWTVFNTLQIFWKISKRDVGSVCFFIETIFDSETL